MTDPTSDRAVRSEAHDWAMRMRGDDADAHHAAFEQWRAADPRHAAAYARLDRQWQQAGLLAQTRIGRARALPRHRSRRWAAPMGLTAAMAVLVMTIGLGVWLRAPDVAKRDSGAGQIASRVGQIRALKLADGSVVTLDTASAVQIAFAPAERRVVLTRGRARFDVAHDARRPFVVVAGNGAVVARGTVFDVSLIAGRISVTLLRGTVDVRDMVGGTKAQRTNNIVRLQPGQRTIFGMAQPPAEPRIAPPVDNAWVSGLLSFDADRLGDALAQANRYSDTKITVADPALNDLRITGAYHVGDAPALARSLAASLRIDADISPGRDIILSRTGS